MNLISLYGDSFSNLYPERMESYDHRLMTMFLQDLNTVFDRKKPGSYLLSSPTSNAKLAKSVGFWNIYNLSMSPKTESMLWFHFNSCIGASPECEKKCLYKVGRNVMYPAMASRLSKMALYLFDRPEFESRLCADIETVYSRETKKGNRIAIRPNCLTDLDYIHIVERYSSVQFYDYTKVVGRYRRFLTGLFPANYHLIFSVSETNIRKAFEFLALGGSIALITELPDRELRNPIDGKHYRVVAGDNSDLRFLDPANVIVRLKPKGKMRYSKMNISRSTLESL